MRLVVGAELTALLQTDFAGDGAAVPPALLYRLCDAPGLQAAVQAQAWPAVDARFAGAASPDAYAVPFARSYIDERLRSAENPAQREFAGELIRNFTPCGSQFDHYLARLYANGEAALGDASDGSVYAVGMRTNDLNLSAPGQLPRRAFRAQAAIYDGQAQRAALDRIYDCFLGYYEQSAERFGAHNNDDVLPSCWGALRQATGRLLPRLRDPGLASQREWVAVAPLRPPAGFAVSGNVLVPSIPLRSHLRGAHPLPFEQVLVHPALSGIAADVGLRAFLRAKTLPSRVLR
ncbi:hypothetical protein HHL21_02065 [Massilia sp. RP-1-19]|uniref:Uncharacterized protein n=1 Tax=Massilia polaris TaxID=2728846 RepID=A0A848HDI9_9BURK|nr:hypothetical protein [Massilia polaris]NML59886.1 hypothetical protein [Massilia polaris]